MPARPQFRLGTIIRRQLTRKLDKRFRSGKADSKCKPHGRDCAPPEPSQPKVLECVPDCDPQKGGANFHPILPPLRGCLPWEKGVRVCPTGEKYSRLQTPCEYDCQPYPGHRYIDRCKVSTCEFRKFQKCYAATRDGPRCLDLAPGLGFTKKIYPITHAIVKNYLPGCPLAGWQRIQANKETDCNFIYT